MAGTVTPLCRTCRVWGPECCTLHMDRHTGRCTFDEDGERDNDCHRCRRDLVQWERNRQVLEDNVRRERAYWNDVHQRIDERRGK